MGEVSGDRRAAELTVRRNFAQLVSMFLLMPRKDEYAILWIGRISVCARRLGELAVGQFRARNPLTIAVPCV